MSRRNQLVLVSLVLVAVVAYLVLRPKSLSDGDDGPVSASATTTLPKVDPAILAVLEAPVPSDRAEELLPMPGCWQNLLKLDQSTAIADLRSAIDVALRSGDAMLLDYLREKLTERIGDKPDQALQVLEWARGARQPALGFYLEALKQAPAVRDARVVEALFGLAEARDSSLELRTAAVDTLETQPHLEPASVARLKKLALEPDGQSAAWVATRTLGKVMANDFQRGGDASPYWKELLTIGKTASEEAVRMLALEMPSYPELIMDAGSIDQLRSILINDPDPHVREMAAHRLSVSEDPDRALEAYREAFADERDLCVRWAITRMAVRAAGADALPTLAGFAKLEPKLQADYEDFKALYASGAVDFSRIWLGKTERIQCLDHEGGEP